MEQTIFNRQNSGRETFNMPKRQIWLFAIIVCGLGTASCNKSRMEPSQLPGQLTTVANDIKYDATDVPLSAATKTALDFLQHKNHGTSISLKSAETVTKNGVPYIHIINASKGFVMLSADSIYPPLLAYDSLNNFDKANINAGLVAWFNKHGEEIDFMRNTKNAYADSIAKVNKELWQALASASAANHNSVHGNSGAITNGTTQGHVVSQTTSYYSTNSITGPLLHSHFTQGYGFNQSCPPGNYAGTTYMPAGCVPVAIAQVMGFFQYGTNVNNGSTYNWPIMPIHEPLGTNDAGYAEVSRLIHDIGITPVPSQAVIGAGFTQFTSYANLNNDGSGGSISDPGNIPYVFGQFQYTSATNTTGSGVQGTAYATLIANEVANNQRPCILSGFPNQGSFVGIINWTEGTGHSWVCDGTNITLSYINTITQWSNGDIVYTNNLLSTTTLLHMNWGLQNAIASPGGPNNDGWYNANVDYTANPANGVDYQAFQTVTYNIAHQ